MKKTITLAFFLMLNFAETSNAQDIFFEKEIRLKPGHECYPIVRSDGTVSLFFINNLNIHGLLFDNNFSLIDEINAEKLLDGNNELLGSNFSDGNYNLIYSSKSHKKFSSASINYSAKSIQSFRINLELKKEEYAGSVSHNDKFYLLTVTKGTSILKMYVFSNAFEYVVKSFDFKDERFSNDNFYRLYDVIRYNAFEMLRDNHFETIDNEIPNTVDIAGKKNKLYAIGDNLVLTLNNQLNRTAIIQIDLRTFESSIKFYKQEDLDCGSDLKASSNSFISNNVLYQFKVCTSRMVLSLTDLETSSKINEFRAERDEDISFINSAITQQGGAYTSDRERELSKTKQFLRKVSAWNAGVSVYHSTAGIEVMLGGYEAIQGSGMGAPMAFPGSTIGTPYGPVATATFSPTYNAYYSYKITKSVYFKSLLNERSYQRETGTSPPNAFDKFQGLTKSFGDLVSAETVFNKGKVYVLGYYLTSRNIYFMRKVED